MAKEAEGLENLPPVVSEYIEAIIKKMRYRRKVRQEVKAELAGHFADALEDCQTEEERQAKAKQRINEFGDAKLLATLIRRGKKRCRPLWRTMVARSFQVLGLTILLLIVYIVWFFSGKPNITIDYVAETNRIVQPVADENLNAAHFYHKAAKSFEDSYDGFVKEHPDLLAMSYDEANDEQKEVLRKWITDNEEIFNLILAGANRPYYWQKYKGEALISIPLPNLYAFRNMARTLCWRALLQAEQGQYKYAFEDLKVCYRFGSHLKGDKPVMEQLTGMSIEKLATKTLRVILDEYELDEQNLTALAEDWSELISQEDFVVSFRMEKMFMYDEIQRCFTDDRIGSGHPYLKRMAGLISGPGGTDLSLFTIFLRALFTHPNKYQTLETVNEFYDYFEEVARKTPGQRRAEKIDVDGDIEQFTKGNLFLKTLMPALNQVSMVGYQNRAGVEATLIIIAILRYKHDVGSYPQNLDRLIEAGLLQTLATDPYSDKPLVYRRTDDGFTLYSVGWNFVDDGGVGKDDKGHVWRWGSAGDTVFWPVR